MKNYVCGFIFSQTVGSPLMVKLIRKNRPSWQAGLLNGIGGSIEHGETGLTAMHRECAEETGLVGLRWSHDTTLTGDDWSVEFYSAHVSRAVFDGAEDLTDECLVDFPVNNLMSKPDLMPNLRVLIPLALDRSGIVKPVLMRDGVPQMDERPQAAEAGL